MAFVRSLAVALVITGLSACFVFKKKAREGDDPGECSDDADNDRDGLFDCDDDDCAGAAACEPVPEPTDPPVDADADVDVDVDADTDADTDTDCQDDSDEPVLGAGNPDEGFDDALQVTSATNRWLTPESPQDYWRFAMSEGNTATVEVTFSSAEGNIDVAIYAPDQTLLVEGTSTDDDEVVTVTADVFGGHYLEVYRTVPGCQSYDFVVTY
ncbi:MAG: hypothetical protein H6734_11540 [Alphaproteobacteria bacterium]|nr:hypothetical protein [Alphaproteobacteria bacterium]